MPIYMESQHESENEMEFDYNVICSLLKNVSLNNVSFAMSTEKNGLIPKQSEVTALMSALDCLAQSESE